MIATCIPVRQLGLFWRYAWPLLERAARRTNGGTEEEVVTALLQGEAQLWGVFDGAKEGGRMVAAVTTQITLLAPEKGCRLWLVGACPEASRRGARMDEWAHAFMAKAEPWARSLGCTVVWGTPSRAGWRRIVRLMGGEEIFMDGKSAWGRRL
jgi:hypothetical protein